MQHTVATDGDGFMLAVPGASGQIVRTGRGDPHAAVSAWDLGAARLALLELGFPAAAEAEVLGDSVVLATMLRTPHDGRWEGVDLEVAQTFVYPAGAAHHAQDPGGLQFAMTVLPWAAFEQAAVDLGADPAMGRRQHVVQGGPLWPLVAPLGRAGPAQITEAPSDPFMVERILYGAVRTVCGSEDLRGGRTRTRGWQDADLVRESLAYLVATGEWIVPVLALCRQVCVSERRLQLAFKRLLGVAPLAYMRHRALQAAHRRLRDASPRGTQVAEVAVAHGFRHLGRFAAAYRQVYGEHPSRTLRRTPQ